MQPEQSLKPPVAQPAPMLTPPSPTVPNLYPEEGFKQPSVAGQPAFQPQYGGPTPPKEPIVYASDYERIMALPPSSKAGLFPAPSRWTALRPHPSPFSSRLR